MLRSLRWFLWIPVVALASCGGGSTKPRPRPDIVLIVVDTLRGDVVTDIDGRYDTPHLDALAEDGVKFSKAFAHAPLTLPSHTSLFSARPPVETVVFNNGQPVPEALPLLAEHLRGYGYETRAVTSLGTLWSAREGVGLWRGFEDYDLDYWHMSQAEGSTARMRASLDRRNAEKPLFMFAHYSDPHEPYNAHGTTQSEAEIYLDGEFLDRVSTSEMSFWHRSLALEAGKHVFEVRSTSKFKIRQFQVFSDDGPRRWQGLEWEIGKRVSPVKNARLVLTQPGDGPAVRDLRLWINDVPDHDAIRARYAREVSYVDRWIGELVDDLKRRGIYDDALVVFTSDHGESLGEHGRVGHANGLTDPHIHVPLIIKPPKGDPRRKALARDPGQVVSHVDVTPTVLELASLPPLPGQIGTSLVRPHDAIHFAETHKPEAKMDKLCLRDERYKMIYLPVVERFLLFDLQEDPGELTDVFAARGSERADWPDLLRALAQQAEENAANGYVPDAAAQANLEALGYGGAN